MADLAKILGDAIDALNAAKVKHPRSVPLPNGTGGGGRVTWMTIARNSCDRAFREGRLTHVEVFDEETAEVMAETDPVKLRAELMDVMATCLRWVEELDDAHLALQIEALSQVNTKRNWVNDVLDRATRTTEAWPDWMRRPEFQTVAPTTAKLGSREGQIDKTE